MTTITVANIREAITIARQGGRDGRGYDQARWCGTSCCVLGWARSVAGVDQVDSGPQGGEIEDTPEGRTLARLMNCSSPDILTVMDAVQRDGTIDLSEANLSEADLRWTNLRGAKGLPE